MRDPENNTLKSTHPLRDATPVCPGRVTTEVAKIHASLAVCYFDPDVYIDEITMLKSTHPVRYATYDPYSIYTTNNA